MTKFSWVPAFEAISEWIADYKDQQSRLLELLAETGIENGLNDINNNEETIPLAEIDPFTFYALFMKYGPVRRAQLFRTLLSSINLHVPSPEDFEGVPSAQALRVWLFPYQKDRTPEMIETLWELFMQARENSIKPETFAKALTIPGTGFAKLTECLFYAFPRRYLPVDAQTRPWLIKHKTTIPTDWQTYQQCMMDISTVSSKPFYEISYEAWLANQNVGFSASSADKYLTERYPGTRSDTSHLIAFRTNHGRELAFDPGQEPDKKKKISIFFDAEPPAYINVNIDKYEAERTRNHHLSTHAPSLATGKPAWIAKINSLTHLESLCDWYERNTGDITSMSISDENSVLNNLAMQSLNQILYGPPGTGKTYATTDMAVKITDPEWYEKQFKELSSSDFRIALKKRYDELVTNERIVFTTFHQSFSYEDFIEGIRAKPAIDNGGIQYGVEDGIFKRIASRADKIVSSETSLGLSETPNIWKISIGRKQDKEMRQRYLDAGEARIGWNKTGDLSIDYDERTTDEQSCWDTLSTKNHAAITDFVDNIQVGDVLLCLKDAKTVQAIGIVTSDYFFDETVAAGTGTGYAHARKVKWLLKDIEFNILPINNQKRMVQQTVYPLSRIGWNDLVAELETQDYSLPLPQVSQSAIKPKPNYVLIIDEINRGNIARIFGELITLLEPDKRKGGTDKRSVVLPYSKEPFSVPSNLYVIGTMNTADRSLVQLDLALRRRFNFFNMPPRPELLLGIKVHGVDMAAMLDTINQRIEVLLDRDHLLGHAYLFPLKNITDEEARAQCLGDIFRNNIIPLLQEYFFDDWERIRWLLNDHRKQNTDAQFITQDGNADLQQLFGNNIQDSLSDRRFRVNAAALHNPVAYQQIITGFGA